MQIEREQWKKNSSFIVAAIGSAIGLGNFWRFPYMAYQNGGGAFLIPYLIALFTAGIPILMLELYLGHRYRKGPLLSYAMANPRWAFIGRFSMGITAIVTVYYAVIMSWAWNFLFKSFTLQWKGQEETFFYQDVLGLSDSIHIFGHLRFSILFGNFITWALIYFILFKGIGVLSKIVHWTVWLPWVILTVLVIRGITLENSWEGLKYYLTPNLIKLLDVNVWLSAYGQIFFSLSLGFGIMVAYASYLPKKTNIRFNAIVIGLSNSMTSLVSGVAVFCLIGYLSFVSARPIEQVIEGGPGLAFVVFPAAIGHLPGGSIVQIIFATLFFIMLILLGIGSVFSLVENIVTNLKDKYEWKREKVCRWVCIGGFILGTGYSTDVGPLWLDIVDHWMNWALIIIGLGEVILMGHFYPINQIKTVLELENKKKLGPLFLINIKYTTPLVLAVILIFGLKKEFSVAYSGFPQWSLFLGGWLPVVVLLFWSYMFKLKKN